MAPIYIMAILTTALSVLVWYGLLWVMAGRWRLLMWLSLCMLPMSALVNLAVKRPTAMAATQAAAGQDPAWYLLFLLFLPPVTEEAVKVLPGLLPPLHRRLKEPGAGLWTGMFLGIGFGLGEIWYLAWGIARSAAFAGIPWWMFTGFLQERVLVVGVHGIMAAVSITALGRGGWRAPAGYVAAVGLHALVNLGALLAQRKVISSATASVWLLVPVALLLVLFSYMYRQSRRAEPVAEQIFFDRSRNG